MEENVKMFSKSEKFQQEYSTRIHHIEEGALTPMENSDFLATLLISGDLIVVRKDEFKGDGSEYVFYAANETIVPETFLTANNLWAIEHYDLNANAKEVDAVITEAENLKKQGKEDEANTKMSEAKSMCGYFYNNRIRVAKLRKTPSYGFVFTKDTLIRWKPELEEYFAQHTMKELYESEEGGLFFDTIGDELFCKAYVPKRNTPRAPGTGKRHNKLNNRLKQFDRIIPEFFSFHYNTDKLADNMWRIKPDTVVDISVKLHGSLGEYANVKTRKKLMLPLRLWNKFSDKFLGGKNRINDVEFAKIYSSHKVIKNQYINKDVTGGYYGKDIWKFVYDIIKDFIPEGYTLYGEIVGYVDDSGAMIQKGYDYGCVAKDNVDGNVQKQYMIYRISEALEDGTSKEWSVSKVKEWTENLIAEHPEIAPFIRPIDLLWHGTLAELYPEIDTENHWQENVLQALKNDKEHFGMELDEPFCKNKVPREGIVLRIDTGEESVPTSAYKLKCDTFRARELKAIDKGEVDMEMEIEYQEQQESGADEEA